MIVTMPVSSMVFFRPLIWLAGSSFAHIFDSGFPRENHVSLLIGTVRPQREDAFVLAYLNDLDAHCHRITNMDRSDKFQRLSQIDAPRSRKIHPDRCRDQGADEEAVGNFSFKLPSLGPYESKDLSAPLNTKLRVYELPDWQNLVPDLQVTSPK